jgi:hypothetical protein
MHQGKRHRLSATTTMPCEQQLGEMAFEMPLKNNLHAPPTPGHAGRAPVCLPQYNRLTLSDFN